MVHLDILLVRGHRIPLGLRPDDVITTSWKITQIRERHDADGVPLLIVVAEAVYATADGGQIASNTETLLYRPRESSP